MKDVYYIDFDTKAVPGKLKAVKVQIGEEVLEANDTPLAINLCEHPLYAQLERYVRENPSAKFTASA
jgi:hypothetical protein